MEESRLSGVLSLMAADKPCPQLQPSLGQGSKRQDVVTYSAKKKDRLQNGRVLELSLPFRGRIFRQRLEELEPMTSICQQLVGIEPWFRIDYELISENDQQRFDEFLLKIFLQKYRI